MLTLSTFFSTQSSGSPKDDSVFQQQLERLKKNAASINSLSVQADQDQKETARERIAEIKKEIEELRKMLLMFGAGDPKAILQQIKQLGDQLKQAASVLNEPSASSTPSTTPGAADSHTDGRTAYAALQASADADTALDTQRAEDERSVIGATEALKSIRSMTEHMAKHKKHA